MTGLLKKACEIGILCGVDVAVSFADLKGNLHVYNNSDNFTLKQSKSSQKAEKLTVKYTAEEYPFQRKYLTQKRKSVKREKEEKVMLGKRPVDLRKDYDGKLTEDLKKINKILKKDPHHKKSSNLLNDIRFDFDDSNKSDFEEEKPKKRKKKRNTVLYIPQLKIEQTMRSDRISTMGSTKRLHFYFYESLNRCYSQKQSFFIFSQVILGERSWT